jgi:AmmeMemoRadiSam system protein B
MSACQFKHVRHPVVAGSFYPSDADELRQLVQFCLAGARRSVLHHLTKAFILPHAGLIYSGSIAGSGYLQLENDRDIVQRVILLGPSHHIAFRGLAVSTGSVFATPLGEIPTDETAIESILDHPGVQMMEAAHAREHSLEVHLPFLQMVLGHFQLVPLVVGNARETDVAAVLERLWGGPETRIIISSDLSHYHDYAVAHRLDMETASRIEKLQSVDPDQACGAVPLNGLLHAARHHRLTSHTLDLRNSGDTAGSRSHAVGYGAFAFTEN